MDTDSRLLIKVPLYVMAVSTGYATALALIERKLHLKPDHEWLEVAIGVGLTLVPVAVEAHAIEQESKNNTMEPVTWKVYEGAIWRSFLAAGTPIICWQIGEAIVRKLELMKYLSSDTQQKPMPPPLPQPTQDNGQMGEKGRIVDRADLFLAHSTRS